MAEDKKCGFFEEAPGQFSQIRLLTFMLVSYAIILSAAIGFVGLTLVQTVADLMPVVVAVTTLLTAISGFAMGFKLAQKPMEKEPEPPKQSELPKP